MPKKAPSTEQSLESIMWNCRNALRGTVGGNEKNHDAVMGLVFLKFAGDKFDKGEFYTPASIIQLIAELIEPYDGVVYDPCYGSGGMFVSSITRKPVR